MFVLHDRPQVCVIFRHVVCGDSVTFRLSVSASHIQSQVKSRRQMLVFMPLAVVWIGRVYRDVIGRKNALPTTTGTRELVHQLRTRSSSKPMSTINCTLQTTHTSETYRP